MKRLYERDDAGKVPSGDAARIRLILAALDAAKRVQDLNVHTFHLHALKGDLNGYWAVTVRANWRIIFRFQDGNALDVDLVDYH